MCNIERRFEENRGEYCLATLNRQGWLANEHWRSRPTGKVRYWAYQYSFKGLLHQLQLTLTEV